MRVSPKPMRDRHFGFALATLLGLVTLAGWGVSGKIMIQPLVAMSLFLIIALVAPGLLLPVNRLWTWLGHYVGSLTNAIILGLLYFVIVSPIGLIMRLTGTDPMTRKQSSDNTSFWRPIDRKANQETYPDLF